MSNTTTNETFFHAVGPGKQFPPLRLNNNFRGKPDMLVAAVQDSGDDDDDDDGSAKEEEEEMPLEEALSDMPMVSIVEQQSRRNIDGAPWKVHDVAAMLLRDRRKRMIVTKSKMILSSQWNNNDDMDTTREILRDQISWNDAKVAIIHETFRIAATTVFDAIYQQQQESVSSTTTVESELQINSPSVNGNCTNDDDDYAHDTEWQNDLPESLRPNTTATMATTTVSPTIAKRTSLSSIRAYCMERSYENKEYTKRKGGKTELLTRPQTKKAKVVVVTTTTTANKESISQQQHSTSPAATTFTNEGVNIQSTTVQRDGLDGITESPPDTHISSLIATTNNNNNNQSTPELQATVLVGASSDHIISSTTTTTAISKSRPTTTVYTTHAILRAAGDFVFGHFTVPKCSTTDCTNDLPLLVGETMYTNDVLTRAKEIAKRSIASIESSLRRNRMRYQYRTMNAYYDNDVEHTLSPFYDHPFAFTRPAHLLDDERNDIGTTDSNQAGDLAEITYQPNSYSLTYEWETYCRPHFLSILHSSAGNAIYIDVSWKTRHGRLADILRAKQSIDPPSTIAVDDLYDNTMNRMENFGPHLIITTENEVLSFAQEFRTWNDCSRIVSNDTTSTDDGTRHQLYALTYRGSKQQRCDLRKLFTNANGLRGASFHVLITSYDDFLEDLLHFSQVPFDTVILDDGVAWMGAREPSSMLGLIWSSALFSSNDRYNGLAGTTNKEWDFSNDDIPEAVLKEAWIGLTVRHRIATASSMTISDEQSINLFPVSNLLEFLMPQFFSDIKEDWDKSKVLHDTTTLDHFRKLLSKFTAVYCDESPDGDMSVLAHNALFGTLQSFDRVDDPLVPTIYTWDDFIESGKSLQRPALRWLGPPKTSWIRHALGKANVQHILDAMKISQCFGPLCEVMTTSSSLTTAGATGQVSGVGAFRLAVRCGRHFGSELGLRQHVSAQHAPSGTWKCRKCSIDCITNQTRYHHEKLCGQTINVESLPTELLGSVDATRNARQSGGKKVNIGKKKTNKPGPSSKSANANDPVSTIDHGENAENVVPALSVINIKDLPLDVKPLLRDPRQTSRTGGNSKRHIYAYRGVCRQARKGHDRWQSQISFAGVNHYLGTFDSEWDAAAIYAWAHLVLYGEEATKLAQKEGEEAAVAYEQEQRDIAVGKIPDPTPKFATKKKLPIRKQKEVKGEENDSTELANEKKFNGNQKGKKGKNEVALDAVPSGVTTKKGKQTSRRDSLSFGNKGQPAPSKQSSVDKEAMTMFLSKSVMKAPMFGPRIDLLQTVDTDLIIMTGQKLKTARTAAYNCMFPAPGNISAVEENLRVCIPYKPTAHDNKNQATKTADRPVGSAMLVGLSASSLGWDLQSFVEESVHILRSEQDSMAALQLLAVEYDDDGVNEKFQSLLQGTVCIIGCATKVTQEMYSSLGLGSVPLGGSVGALDCHIGGVPGSCSELAACIRYAPNATKSSLFQLSCISRDDVVTVNGERVTPDKDDVHLHHEDIVSVGARVFAFVLPKLTCEK